MQNRYLTKSRFKLGLECPTKLFYFGKEDVYPNRKKDDDFLHFLAEGGYQTGELAKCYFPDGIEVTSKKHDEALAETDVLLMRENVTIFEAAVRFGNFFIRIDILKKTGSRIEIIEVKAKSYDPEDPAKGFLTRKVAIRGSWEPYLYDIAFQTWVFRKAFPDRFESIEPFLMLADKTKTATVDGLNTKFYLDRDNQIVRNGDVSPAALGERLLCAVDVEAVVRQIWETDSQERYGRTFDDLAGYLSDCYNRDIRITPSLGSHCKGCEYRALPEEESAGKKSGFKECWKTEAGFFDADFSRGLILDLWRFSGKDSFISGGKYFLDDVPEDFAFSDKSAERQRLQIDVWTGRKSDTWLDRKGVRMELAGWKYPLHFIDFETMRVALPFFKGHSPYEQIAFQFSHHVVEADGSIRHAGEWINTGRGDPNFEFVRQLKAQLGSDDGSIFRYAQHENSVLKDISRKLEASGEPDREELVAWISTVTDSGSRTMIDMLDLVKRCYYHKSMKGSNSIKAVLPAVLQSSRFLQEKYGRDIYGTDEIPSCNFRNRKWIEFDDAGLVINPYYSLTSVFEQDETRFLKDTFVNEIQPDEDFTVNVGGAAMKAYSKMQFSETSEAERKALTSALLKYCELDTFAMVLLYEFFKDEAFAQGK